MDRVIKWLTLLLGLMLAVLAGLALEYKRQIGGGKKTVTAVNEVRCIF